MIVYLHGFNSSPQSHKAQVLKRTMEERGRMLMSLASGQRGHSQSKIAASYEAQAKELQRHAQQIRKMLLEARNA